MDITMDQKLQLLGLLDEMRTIFEGINPEVQVSKERVIQCRDPKWRAIVDLVICGIYHGQVSNGKSQFHTRWDSDGICVKGWEGKLDLMGDLSSIKVGNKQ